ncbi:MAG: hypothetical protein HC787_05475 [Nostocaceae cyanobacterium CSU_2_110]|nr:hypothetical protein [Nostocaceae cyanobacterium CSU_2_110]
MLAYGDRQVIAPGFIRGFILAKSTIIYGELITNYELRIISTSAKLIVHLSLRVEQSETFAKRVRQDSVTATL